MGSGKVILNSLFYTLFTRKNDAHLYLMRKLLETAVSFYLRLKSVTQECSVRCIEVLQRNKCHHSIDYLLTIVTRYK